MGRYASIAGHDDEVPSRGVRTQAIRFRLVLDTTRYSSRYDLTDCLFLKFQAVPILHPSWAGLGRGSSLTKANTRIILS